MKGCAEWLAAIEECALGDEAGWALAAHLAVCPECSSALRQRRATVARIDEALGGRAAVEPPLDGPERVMARVSARNHRAATRWWWQWAALGSAAAVLMAAILWMRRPTPETDVTALLAWRSPTQALLRPPVSATWGAMPRLGEGFFKIRPSGEIHVH